MSKESSHRQQQLAKFNHFIELLQDWYASSGKSVVEVSFGVKLPEKLIQRYLDGNAEEMTLEHVSLLINYFGKRGEYHPNVFSVKPLKRGSPSSDHQSDEREQVEGDLSQS